MGKRVDRRAGTQAGRQAGRQKARPGQARPSPAQLTAQAGFPLEGGGVMMQTTTYETPPGRPKVRWAVRLPAVARSQPSFATGPGRQARAGSQPGRQPACLRASEMSSDVGRA